MTRCARGSRRVFAFVAGLAALLAAGAAIGTAPDSSQITAIFPVAGAVGDTVTARLLSVTTHSVVISRDIVTTYSGETERVSSTGYWVVVDATVVPTEGTLSLENAELKIGNDHYRASGILPAPSLDLNMYGAGVPLRGTLLFEIPGAAISGPAASEAIISFNPLAILRLDSVPQIQVDLSTIEVTGEADVPAATVVDSL